MAALDWFESILAEGVRIEKIRQNLALLESNIAPHGQGFEPMGQGGGSTDAMVGMAMLSARLGELRRLLDERGVKWRARDGVHPITVWHDEQCVYEYMERTLLDGVTPYTGEVVDGTGRLEAVIHVCTPEQAIEATLGSENTYTREDVESAFVSGYSLGSLPVGSDPQWDENRQTVDEHMAELGWIRKDAWTCRMKEVNLPTFGGHDDGYFIVCSECGFAIYERRSWSPIKYCSNCGRKVVDG